MSKTILIVDDDEDLRQTLNGAAFGMDYGDVIMHGFLHKKSDFYSKAHVSKNVWQKRWVVLDEADALLAGSFKPSARARYPITELIMALKQRKRAADLEAYRERVGDATAGGGGESGGGEQDARGRRLQAGFDGAQFVLVGATLPNAGTRNVERWVRAAFPDASWLRTERAHREVAEVRQFFVQVEPAQRAAAKRNASGLCLGLLT